VKRKQERHSEKTILSHDDLTIKVSYDQKGQMMFEGRSEKYKPHHATAATLLDCFFCFDIQLADQKKIASLLNEVNTVNL